MSSMFSAERMSLPFTPLAISFKEVNYYISMPPELKEQGLKETRLQLLKGISGAFRPGTITALMGESGAGKTTLMDVLAGRKTSGYIEGDIRIAGYPKKHTTFARVSGYCEQFDVHSSQLTVTESLIFSALLRLPKEVNLQDKYRFLNEVMELVELDNIKGALVGIPGINGLSIEQRKRLTIAVELVANPSIVFMDEPTSGLDARAAAIVMRTVRNIANSGRTVVCTIHQPSIDIFESFDELLLMKRGGQITYSGPLGENSQELIKYFEEIPGVKKIDQRNPAEWVIEESSIATEARLGLDFAKIYSSSFQNKRNMQLVRELSKPVSGSSDLHFPTQYPQSSLHQLKLFLWKYRSMYWRNPDYNLSRFSMSLIIALLTGIFFWKIGQHRDTLGDLTSIIGTMYLALLFIGFGNRSTVQPFTASERLVFYREKASEMYSAFPYALSQVIIELPYVFFQSLYSVPILYSMMSLQWTTMKFTWLFIIFFLTILCFTYLGMLCVALSPNMQVAAILANSFFLLFHLFAGFYIPRPVSKKLSSSEPLQALPKWWGWYYWLNPVSWALYGFIITQYGDMRDMIKVPGQEDQQIRDVILSHYGYKEGYTIAVIAALLAFASLFAFMYCLCIRMLNFQRR